MAHLDDASLVPFKSSVSFREFLCREKNVDVYAGILEALEALETDDNRFDGLGARLSLESSLSVCPGSLAPYFPRKAMSPARIAAQ